MLLLCAACAVVMVAAAVIDARSRTFPNGLAAVFAVLSGTVVLAGGGVGLLGSRVLAAVSVCGALVLFELVWRRFHDGAAGLGMGDVKFLFGCMLLDPLMGLCSFAVGLVLLAVAGIVARRQSLPLLPFVVCAYAALVVLEGSGFWF